MNSVRCAQCGFINWVEAGACRRCGAQLAFLEEVAPRDARVWDAVERRPTGTGSNVCTFCGTEFQGYFCTLCRKPVRVARMEPDEPEKSIRSALFGSMKAKVVAASLLFLAALALFFIAKWYGGNDASEFQAHLIRNSEAFRRPLTVSFAERSSEIAPGVEVLEELGLVSTRVGPMTLRRTEIDEELWVEETAAAGEIEPSDIQTKVIARAELTESGLHESDGWESFEFDDASLGPWRKSTGWHVPLGEREFIEIRRVYPATAGTYELSAVEFTWRWKPNEVGRYFDTSGAEFRSLPDEARQSVMRLAFNDSTKIYTGTATLRLHGGAWSMQDVNFVQANLNAQH